MNRFQEVYEYSLRRFLNSQENQDKTEIDFINQEIPKTEKLIQQIKGFTDNDLKKEILEKKEYEYFKRLGPETEGYEGALNDLIRTHKEINSNKLAEYKGQIQEYNFKLQRLKGNNRDEKPLDLSMAIGTEKIIYLKELGILDYLLEFEPFRTSTNSLATAISAITGIHQETAQSYLNPITNPTAGQKNNPLNSTKKVEKIKQTLINLGFNPIK